MTRPNNIIRLFPDLFRDLPATASKPKYAIIQNLIRNVIQSLFFRAKNLTILLLSLKLLLTFSCTPYTDPTPSTERAIYPTECDSSPIELGTLKIYDTDSIFLTSIDLDHQYVPTGTYYIDLAMGTYIFKLHSDYTNQTAFFKIAIHMKSTNIDLNICEGD